MTIALARRYRPRRFADLLVQEHVAAVLRGAVAHGRAAHGYLLTGPRGVGKTTAARILAMALNCERRETMDPPGEPCGECPSCTRIWSGAANLDVVEIDAASNRGVDDARELRERAMYAASQEGHHKVYIVDEAHMLTREAWNALLKILEEPPPGVVFVFATTEPQKIAQAAAPVMSRLQRFDFRRIGPAPIRQRLREVVEAEGIEAEDDALLLIARQADGGMRDALSILDQCLSFGAERVTVEGVRQVLGMVDDELYGELLGIVAGHRAADAFALVDRVLDAGGDLGEFMNGAGEALRALLMLQVGATPDHLTEGLRKVLEEYRDQLAPGDVLRMLKLLADAENGVRRSANPRLQVETLLLRWTLMDRTVDLEAALQGMSGAAPAPAGSPARPAKPAPAPSRDEELAPRAGKSGGSAGGPDSGRPAGTTPLTREGLTDAWEDIVAAVRAESPFLAGIVGESAPERVEGAEVALRAPPGNPMAAETLERQHEVVEAVLARAVGRPVTLKVLIGEGRESTANPAKRLSDTGARAERLKAVRTRDPALDAAADALDLEIVD